MGSATADISSLFQAAQTEGEISQETLNNFEIADLGQSIQNSIGVHVDDVQASAVLLVQLVVDDSGSIRMAGNSEIMREGVNMIIDSLLGTKQKDGILMNILYIGGQTLTPWESITKIPKLDTTNYNPQSGTPLYDRYLEACASLVSKAQSFSDKGVPVRAVLAIVSDGADQHSPKAHGGRGTTPEMCKKASTDLLQTEKYILIGVGIDDKYTDFRQVYSSMGIPNGEPSGTPNFILTPGNTPHEIREAFGTVSQSAVRASQNGASFSQTAMGGFTN
jgi:hypothetical protein